MNKNLQQIVNRRQILRKILEKKEISRADLARELGMYRSTVSNLVDNLLKEDWLTEEASTARPTPVGRRALSLSINKEKGILLGLALRRGGSFDLVATDLSGRELFSHSADLPSENLMELLPDLILSRLKESPVKGKTVLGMGLSLSGLVDTKQQQLINTEYPDYENQSLSHVLANRFPFPVLVENDSRCCAWGKAWTSHLFEKATFVYLYLTGDLDMGMGLYVDGDMLYGANNHSGEFSPRFVEKATRRFEGLTDLKNHDLLREPLSDLVKEFLDMIYIIDPAHIYLGHRFKPFQKILNDVLPDNSNFTPGEMGDCEAAFGAACFFLYQLYKTPSESLLPQVE